jgi:hypothetical protein
MHTTKSILRTLAIFAFMLAATLGMDAQKKDKAMERQVFYRTVKVDGLSIFYREAGQLWVLGGIYCKSLSSSGIVINRHPLNSVSPILSTLYSRNGNRPKINPELLACFLISQK